MIYHRVYKCPKCFNTLLVSNKMLHDLRCTEENPATYENILFRQSQQMSNDTSYNNYNNSGYGERMSIKNDDGTMIDIRKEKSIRGKDEYVEIKYDPQGNVISRKKASNHGYGNDNFDEFDDFEDDDFNLNYDNNNNTYYEMNHEPEIRKSPSVIVETAEAQEIVYEAPAKYDPHVTINKPIFEETYLSSNDGVTDGIIDDIIRNTLTRENNNNNYDKNYDNNYNIQNDANINSNDYSTYSYSQSKDTTTKKSYNKNYNMNSYNNQYNIGNTNSYNEYTKTNQSNGNKHYGADSFNYDYHF